MARQDRIGSVATTIHTSNGYTRVTYHSTCVLKFSTTDIVLNSGGYRTATTKTRINQASAQFDLGLRVYQEKRAWYVVTRLPDRSYDWDHPSPFVDGMRLARV